MPINTKTFLHSVFTDMSSLSLLLVYFWFPRDYDSLRKEDVFENNRLVRCQVVKPLCRREVT